MAKRNYPNDYDAWYNDDDRLAIVERVTSTDSSSTHKETWDSFQSDGDLSGNITDTSTGAGSSVVITSNAHGLTYSSTVQDRVAISGTTSYDGNYTITAADTNTFTISATNSESNEGASSGVIWKSLFVDNGLRITFHSKYEEVSAITDDLKTGCGLDSGMHHALVYYVKFRLLQDQGDIQQAEYYRNLFEKVFKQYPSRKSGVRSLSVPRI